MSSASHIFDRFLELHGESDTLRCELEGGDQDAQSKGCFGITHNDMISSWVDFLDNELRYAYDAEGKNLYDNHYDTIMTEIKECSEWHEKNGSLFDQI